MSSSSAAFDTPGDLAKKALRCGEMLPPAAQSNNRNYRYPVSVKGVVFVQNRVVLLKNERDEWELPGGKLELGEAPKTCVLREIEEELGLRPRLGSLLDVWVYHIFEGADVLIVTYGCHPLPPTTATRSPEHKDVGLFARSDVDELKMPEGYKVSIRNWFRRVELS